MIRKRIFLCFLLVMGIAMQVVSAYPIGPQPVPQTPLSKGTVFASPAGSGSACSEGSPCNLTTALEKAGPGDVVFLRGGVYPVSANIYFNRAGLANNPITVESYPGENAVLDGSCLANGTGTYVRVTGSWYILRDIEIRKIKA